MSAEPHDHSGVTELNRCFFRCIQSKLLVNVRYHAGLQRPTRRSVCLDFKTQNPPRFKRFSLVSSTCQALHGRNMHVCDMRAHSGWGAVAVSGDDKGFDRQKTSDATSDVNSICLGRITTMSFDAHQNWILKRSLVRMRSP